MSAYREKFSPIEFAAFRRASGKELAELCGRLASWPNRPEGMEVYLPREDTAECTRAELARATELLAGSSPIAPERLVTESMHRKLRDRVPSLDESIPHAHATAVKCGPAGNGGYFIGLELDPATGSALGAQRNRLWQAMELIAGVPVGSSGWTSYHPDVKLGYIGPDAMITEDREILCNAIGAAVHLMPIHLSAAELPTQST